MERVLNVAIATDTILYAPFYTALYGGDFEDTPFGNVNINIIAREDDPYFSKDLVQNLKAVDGFVTFCLIFDYADIGICDPSFIIQICETNNQDLVELTFKPPQ